MTLRNTKVGDYIVMNLLGGTRNSHLKGKIDHIDNDGVRSVGDRRWNADGYSIPFVGEPRAVPWDPENHLTSSERESLIRSLIEEAMACASAPDIIVADMMLGGGDSAEVWCRVDLPITHRSEVTRVRVRGRMEPSHLEELVFRDRSTVAKNVYVEIQRLRQLDSEGDPEFDPKGDSS